LEIYLAPRRKERTSMKQIVISLIKLYKILISPLLSPSCRFFPSCSDYSIMAIDKYGIAKGGLLTIKRILKCHPFHAGGYDPVE
jgi:putative membrane protein insertion efficiency factor